MNHARHFLPPRQSVVYGYTRRMLDETATNSISFAMAVAERYVATTAPDVRHVPFKLGEGDALLAAQKNNGQILRRYMDGTVKVLPADLEDAWVSALPQPYRGECERDLAQRRGMLAVSVCDAGAAGKAVGVAGLTRDFARMLEEVAPALANGRLCNASTPQARRILAVADDVISDVLAVRKAITGLLPEGVAHA